MLLLTSGSSIDCEGYWPGGHVLAVALTACGPLRGVLHRYACYPGVPDTYRSPLSPAAPP